MNSLLYRLACWVSRGCKLLNVGSIFSKLKRWGKILKGYNKILIFSISLSTLYRRGSERNQAKMFIPGGMTRQIYTAQVGERWGNTNDDQYFLRFSKTAHARLHLSLTQNVLLWPNYTILEQLLHKQHNFWHVLYKFITYSRLIYTYFPYLLNM